MPTFKNMTDILNNPWNYDFNVQNASFPILPTFVEWDQDRQITVNDVILWEQLYYEPGNVGIYAAYNPHAEFYIITHNLFLRTVDGIEIFTGPNCIQNCYNRAKDLGISLPNY